MNKDIIMHRAIEFIEQIFKDNSDGHDAKHSLRVYKNAQLLLKSYPQADKFITLLSALLHDVDDHKLFDSNNNDNARAFMSEQKIPEETIETICKVINKVSFSNNKGQSPKTLEGKIVQDADRLDALGAIGIARAFAYGGKSGRSLDESVQHFYEKLFLLKDEMNTDVAKKMATLRHNFMKAFLQKYKMETRLDKNILF